MEGRPSRGRGGSWKRGGRGGHDSDSSGGEHRGRGRGGHHRGRGRRDHYRGRGRGGSSHAAEFHHRNKEEGETFGEEDGGAEVFSRRKLESNWERYEASEKQEPDDETPTQRGSDYHALLGTAGDSFTQFRFAEEKDWAMDSSAASQMSAVLVDLPALAQILQQVPLQQRLNLEAELLQVSTPEELPAVALAPKQEPPRTFTPTTAALKAPSTEHRAPAATHPAAGSDSRVPPVPAELHGDDGDEELDQLLSLTKPVSSSYKEAVAPEKVCEEKKEVIEEKMEEVKHKEVAPPKCSVKQEMTEDDLEDWLDSMIS